MSREQAQQVEALLREAALDVGGDVVAVRAQFEAMMAAVPLAGDVRTEPDEIAGVPVVRVSVAPAPSSTTTVLYLHGGAYALGSAAAAAGLVSELCRRTGAAAVSVDYRLAPEHPFPAGLQDVVAVYRGLLAAGNDPADLVLAGESAGAGLVAAALVALRDDGVPLPAAAWLASPWADLSLSGPTVTSKAAVDPALTPAALGVRSRDYLAGHDATDGRVSAVFADLTGLPPLLVQVGSHEILLSDATRLAARAAECDVSVTLQVTPGVPHVFVGFPGLLDEAVVALDAAAAFLLAHTPVTPDQGGESVGSGD